MWTLKLVNHWFVNTAAVRSPHISGAL